MSFISDNNIPLGLAIQRGLVNNFSGVQKFGYNASVGTSFVTRWAGGGDYTFLTVALGFFFLGEAFCSYTNL